MSDTKESREDLRAENASPRAALWAMVENPPPDYHHGDRLGGYCFFFNPTPDVDCPVAIALAVLGEKE